MSHSLLVMSVSYGFAIVWLHDATRWRVLLAFGLTDVLLSAITLVFLPMIQARFLMSVYQWFWPCWWTLLILVAIVVVAIDLRRQIARDCLHWLGVSFWALFGASKLLLALIAIAIAQHGPLGGSGLEIAQFGLLGGSRVEIRPGGPPNGLPYERLFWYPDDFFADRGVLSLCQAIEARDLQEMERLVKSGVDVNAKGRGNMTPLLWAFPMGEQVFAKVLELGGDPNIKLTETRIRPVFVKGRSVTSLAASPDPVVYAWDDVSTDNHLKLVLENGGDPNIEDLHGNTPIFYLRGDLHILRTRIHLLLDAGADINHRNKRGMTPLINWYISPSISKDSVLCLLEAGADYRIPDNHGFDLILYLASDKRFHEKYRDPKNRMAESELAAIQPLVEWLTAEGVNWQEARSALKSPRTMKNLKKLPANYKHRPWFPQRPTLIDSEQI